MDTLTVSKVPWEKERVALTDIRNRVFIEEQGVTQELEWDDQDKNAQHFLAMDGETAVGCARLLQNEKIGRMAVLAQYRGQGVGHRLLDHIQRHAAQNRITRLQLSAQCHAFDFYYQNGFAATSLPYEDANIPHIDMDYRVFSDEQDTRYRVALDEQIHHGTDLIQAHGLLDMALSQCGRSIVLSLKDLNHPLTRSKNLQNRIKQQARKNRHFKVLILLNNYHPSYNDHPLFKLQDRLPSFITIKTIQEPIPGQWVFDHTAWFDYNILNSRACYSDRSAIKLFMERFKQWWQQASPIRDARRLAI